MHEMHGARRSDHSSFEVSSSIKCFDHLSESRLAALGAQGTALLNHISESLLGALGTQRATLLSLLAILNTQRASMSGGFGVVLRCGMLGGLGWSQMMLACC